MTFNMRDVYGAVIVFDYLHLLITSSWVYADVVELSLSSCTTYSLPTVLSYLDLSQCTNNSAWLQMCTNNYICLLITNYI